MTIAYKLTDRQMQTHNGFQWKLGVPAPTLDGDGSLCSNHWYHLYSHPLLAVLHNPIHGRIKDPLGFKADCGGKFLDDFGLKCGYTEVMLIKKIELPKVTLTQHVAYGILCSLQAPQSPEYKTWANNWLTGVDRTWAAEWAAWEAARAAEVAAAEATAWVAWAATEAATWEYKQLDLLRLAKKALKYD